VKGHLATVEIWGTPEGAEVLRGGKPVGRLPNAHVRAPSEDAQLLVRLTGYVEVSRVLQIPKRGLVREHVELLPLPAEPAKPVAPAKPALTAAAPPPKPVAAPPTVEDKPATTPPAQADSMSWRRPLRWAAFGVGAAALAGGITENIVAAVKANRFNAAHCTKDSQGRIAGGSSCEELDRDQSNATSVAVIGYSMAGALLATALVLYLTEPSGAPGGTASAACAPTVGAMAGLGCRIIW